MASESSEQGKEISMKLLNVEGTGPSQLNLTNKECIPSSCIEESVSKKNVDSNDSDLSKRVDSRDIPLNKIDDQIDEDAVLCDDETEKDINIDSNNIDEDELLKDSDCDVVGSSEQKKSAFLTNSVDSIAKKSVEITDCDSQSANDRTEETEAVSAGNVKHSNSDLDKMVTVIKENQSVTGTKTLPQDMADSTTEKKNGSIEERFCGFNNDRNDESSNVQNKLTDEENLSKDGEDSHNALSMDESSTTNIMDSGDDDDRQTKFLHIDQDTMPDEPMDVGDNAVDPFAQTTSSPERQQQSSEIDVMDVDGNSITDDKHSEENSNSTENIQKDRTEEDTTSSKSNEEEKSGTETSNDVPAQDKESESENQKGPDEDFCIIPDKMPGKINSKDVSRICKIVINEDENKDMEIDLTNEKSDATNTKIITTPSRPQRQAAKKAESQIKQAALAESADIEELDSDIDDPDDPNDPESDIQECQQCGKVCFQVAVTAGYCFQKLDDICYLTNVRPCKISVITYGKTNYYCGEECFSRLRRFQNVAPDEGGEPNEQERDVEPVSETEPNSVPVPETEPVPVSVSETISQNEVSGVNEENVESDKQTTVIPQDRSEFVRKCSQCNSIITPDERSLSWETMDFCHEDCLGKYQMKLGSHCANCKGNVQPASLGKYCVRFGYDIKQFCCAACLEEFKKGLKVCSFCQKDISSGTEGFLAPVGDKGQFKDFCTQACMEKYEQMSNNQPPPPQMHPCDVCNNEKLVMVEVIFDKKINKLCSEVCFNAFKFVNTLSVDRCDMCKKYFDKDNSDREAFSVFYDSEPRNFCCKTCMNVYILSKRKIVPCNWCKVKKYNFDMIKRVLNTGQMLMMCSLNCLTLYQVSVNAVSSRRIKCDFCSSITQAQYHLTMSDATVRNFCSYPCVMSFQSQYSKSPITLPTGEACPTPTGVPKRVVPRRSTPISENTTMFGGAVAADLSWPARQSRGVECLSDSTVLGSRERSPVLSCRCGHSHRTKGPSQALPVISSVTSLAQNGQQPTPQTPVSGSMKVNSTVGNKSPVSQQVLVKVQEPKEVKNVYVQCRPYSHTKGVSCRPHPCAKETQTELEGENKPILIPVPVPIYVPAPVAMYSYPLPIPVPFPIPVPVPIFVPTTRNSASGIFKEIKRIQEKIPTDPFEAELLMMAAMVAGEKKEAESSSESEDGPEAGETNEACGENAGETGFSPEAMESSNTFGDDMLQMALKMASELDEPAVDLEAALTPATITPQTSSAVEHNEGNEEEDDQEGTLRNSQDSRTRKRPIQRTTRAGSATTPDGVSAQKRRRSSSNVELPILPPPAAAPPPRIEQEKPDANMKLKYTLGVSAWRHWVGMKNTELEKMSGNNRKVKLFKPEILQLTADELNYSLCLFVKEVRKPNGTEYAPDIIYYLCLGIQQYLFENGRIDNIFTDSYYEKFTDCLDEVAKKFDGPGDDRNFIVTRVEEEHLWESKQLGAHSPHVLLSTLMFFNTKHFNLTTVEEHMQLSFSHIMKHWKRNPIQTTATGGSPKVPGSRNVLLRFYPPQSALEAPNSRKKKVYEQAENEENPLRCPVKLYEFYLSKCPESVKTRNDVFYLQPERSCVPDSPVWYSTMALGKEPLCKMLHRIKMVKEINTALTST